MSQLAGMLGGGGGASVSASSSASAGPQTGTTGSLLLDFGGINLGNQDIPLNASTTSSANNPPLIGNTPAGVLGGPMAVLESYLPYILLIGAGVALYMWAKGKL
jgi:hypothetical protein